MNVFENDVSSAMSNTISSSMSTTTANTISSTITTTITTTNTMPNTYDNTYNKCTIYKTASVDVEYTPVPTNLGQIYSNGVKNFSLFTTLLIAVGYFL